MINIVLDTLLSFEYNTLNIQHISVLKILEKELTIQNPQFLTLERLGKSVYNVTPTISLFYKEMNKFSTGKGALKLLIKLLDEHKIKYNVIDNTTIGKPHNLYSWNPDITLREYQLQALDTLLKTDRGVLHAPAGSGKTIMGMSYIQARKQKALWLTHTIELLNQSMDSAKKVFQEGNFGQLGGGKKEYNENCDIIFASLTSFNNLNDEQIENILQYVGTVVIDEVHHLPAETYRQVLEKIHNKYTLGITATPERKDNLHFLLYNITGEILFTIPREQLYDDGYLIIPNVEFIYTKSYFDTAEYSTDGKVNYLPLIQKLSNDEERLELIANTIIENSTGNGKYSIVLSEYIDYAIKLKERVDTIIQEKKLSETTILIHGGLKKTKWLVKPQSIARKMLDDGLALKIKKEGRSWKVQVPIDPEYFKKYQMNTKERAKAMEQVKNKEINILFATKLAKEGLDIPHLEIGYLVIPKRGDSKGQKNGISVEQEIGRIMRKDPKNPNKSPIWFDFVDDNIGIFKNQYSSRRKVYTRLGIKLSRKPKDILDSVLEDILNEK